MRTRRPPGHEFGRECLDPLYSAEPSILAHDPAQTHEEQSEQKPADCNVPAEVNLDKARGESEGVRVDSDALEPGRKSKARGAKSKPLEPRG